MATRINQPSDGNCGYIALYSGKQAEVWANSWSDAKELAVKHFKASKAKRHLVSVHLCEKDGEPVTTPTDF